MVRKGPVPGIAEQTNRQFRGQKSNSSCRLKRFGAFAPTDSKIMEHITKFRLKFLHLLVVHFTLEILNNKFPKNIMEMQYIFCITNLISGIGKA